MMNDENTQKKTAISHGLSINLSIRYFGIGLKVTALTR